jgi:hypothetical protein
MYITKHGKISYFLYARKRNMLFLRGGPWLDAPQIHYCICVMNALGNSALDIYNEYSALEPIFQ